MILCDKLKIYYRKKKGMLGKNDILVQKVSFFEKNSLNFKDVQKIASDFAAQNLPVQVCSKDVILRKWFSELISWYKYKSAENFVYVPCSVFKVEKLVPYLSSLKPETVVLLDQIETLSVDVQNDILGLIENQVFASRNILVVAGTSENLDELTQNNLFSPSLGYRLNLLKMNLPVLSENPSEILPLANYFLRIERFETGKDFEGFTDGAKEALAGHLWKGGLGELKSVISGAVVKGIPPMVSEADLDLEKSHGNAGAEYEKIASSLGEDKTMKNALDSFKRFYVMKILEENGNNQTRTAEVLGLQRTYVSRLMNELHIR